MSAGQRTGGVAAVFRDAESESWSCRAAAGRRLAAMAGQKEFEPVLERLVLDLYNTAVTQETVEALLERGDLVGLRLVLAALSRAEEWCTADQLDGDVFNYQSWMIADGRGDQFAQQLEALATDEDAGVREEAMRLLGSGPEAG
ncbi:hypothetical protein ACWD4F_14085 [Streptomyces aureus]